MTKVALVTGANQGLGFALVKGLANRLGADDIVYLAARSEARGRAAVGDLGQTRAAVRFAPLDVTDHGSITALADLLEATHGGVDIVASNAAARIAKDVPQAEQVRDFVATNNHGSRALLGALLPLLNRGSRYVVVASAFGRLTHLPEVLHGAFDTDHQSLDDIESTMDRFVEAVEAGRAAAEGWPEWINIPSKVGQVATARIAAREVARARPQDGILVNAVCPGLVDTAASRPWFDDMSSAQTPEQAAAPIVELLLTAPDRTEPAGELVQFGKVLAWS